VISIILSEVNTDSATIKLLAFVSRPCSLSGRRNLLPLLLLLRKDQTPFSCPSFCPHPVLLKALRLSSTS